MKIEKNEKPKSTMNTFLSFAILPSQITIFHSFPDKPSLKKGRLIGFSVNFSSKVPIGDQEFKIFINLAILEMS